MSGDERFKESFKYFKRKETLPNYDFVVDFSNPEWQGISKKLTGKTNVDSVQGFIQFRPDS